MLPPSGLVSRAFDSFTLKNMKRAGFVIFLSTSILTLSELSLIMSHVKKEGLTDEIRPRVVSVGTSVLFLASLGNLYMLEDVLTL